MFITNVFTSCSQKGTSIQESTNEAAVKSYGFEPSSSGDLPARVGGKDTNPDIPNISHEDVLKSPYVLATNLFKSS
jgi:hypothetical protein